MIKKKVPDIYPHRGSLLNAIEALEMHLIIDYEQKATFSRINSSHLSLLMLPLDRV